MSEIERASERARATAAKAAAALARLFSLSESGRESGGPITAKAESERAMSMRDPSDNNWRIERDNERRENSEKYEGLAKRAMRIAAAARLSQGESQGEREHNMSMVINREYSGDFSEYTAAIAAALNSMSGERIAAIVPLFSNEHEDNCLYSISLILMSGERIEIYADYHMSQGIKITHESGERAIPLMGNEGEQWAMVNSCDCHNCESERERAAAALAQSSQGESERELRAIERELYLRESESERVFIEGESERIEIESERELSELRAREESESEQLSQGEIEREREYIEQLSGERLAHLAAARIESEQLLREIESGEIEIIREKAAALAHWTNGEQLRIERAKAARIASEKARAAIERGIESGGPLSRLLIMDRDCEHCGNSLNHSLEDLIEDLIESQESGESQGESERRPSLCFHCGIEIEPGRERRLYGFIFCENCDPLPYEKRGLSE